MSNNNFSDFSELQSSNYEHKEINTTTTKTKKDNVEMISNAQVFEDYLNSDISDDMDSYFEQQEALKNKENGNLAELLPSELTSKKKNKLNVTIEDKVLKPSEKPEEDFKTIMDRKGFHFDEESGILEF